MSKVPWTWPNSTITRVVDGDTIAGQMTMDIGFHGSVTFEQKLRLNRINAPNGKTADGIAATGYLTSILLPVVGVTLETLKVTDAYKYGDEWMVEITLPTGENVSDLMVSSGHSVYWNGQGPRPADTVAKP